MRNAIFFFFQKIKECSSTLTFDFPQLEFLKDVLYVLFDI